MIYTNAADKHRATKERVGGEEGKGREGGGNSLFFSTPSPRLSSKRRLAEGKSRARRRATSAETQQDKGRRKEVVFFSFYRRTHRREKRKRCADLPLSIRLHIKRVSKRRARYIYI
jgi:hypothetical protein